MLSDILHPLPNNIWGLKDKTLIIPKVIRQNWYEHFICVIKNANNTTLLCHLAFGIIAKIYENTVEIETPSKPSPKRAKCTGNHDLFLLGSLKILWRLVLIIYYFAALSLSWVEQFYRVSLKKGTLAIFCLISVLEVGFYFFTCVSESEFWARFI